ncbi:MAG: transketolase [Lachnospiraceae bacterium oral taxon 082]|nr:transketolase [Lachnospiraceae bacterium oral taxon 082]
MENLKELSYELRKYIIDLIVEGKGGHIGGDMSSLDILIELYFEQMNITPQNFKESDHDHFIMSKGHSVEALYAVLAEKKFIDKDELLCTFSKFGSKYIGHPSNKINGIEVNSGSLGHGLSVGVGMALAERMNESPNRVYVLMGDGEMAEGSIWEAIAAGGQFELDNLCAIVDMNGLQISGRTKDIMGKFDMSNKWEAFGWNVISVDGHDFEKLNAAFNDAKKVKGMPTVVLARTVKGYGSKVMEDKANWHHRVPTTEEYEEIIKELEERKECCK